MNEQNELNIVKKSQAFCHKASTRIL